MLTCLPRWPLTDKDAKLAVFCNSPTVRRPSAGMSSEAIANRGVFDHSGGAAVAIPRFVECT